MQALAESIPGSNALENFCGQDGAQREFTGELRSILEVIATTGKYWHNWSQLKSLMCFRLAQVMQEYNVSRMQVDEPAAELVHGERFSDLMDRLLEGIESFTQGAPFTSQRLCELLLNPKDTYVNLDKLSLAFEKLLLVTSTEPASTDPYPALVQPPTKQIEPLVQKEVRDGIPPEVFIINGAHETNGRHEEIQDEEMADVEGIVDRPLEVEASRPLEVEDNRPLEVEINRPLEAEANRPLEVEANRPLEVEANRQLEVQVNRQLEVEVNRQLEVQVNRQLEVQVNRPSEVEANRQLEVQVNRQLEVQVNRPSEEEANRPLEVEVSRPLEAEANRPVEAEGTQPASSVPTDTSEKAGPGEPPNEHIGTSGDEVVGDITLGNACAE